MLISMAADLAELRKRRGDYGVDGSVPGLIGMAAGGLLLSACAAAAVHAGRKLLATIALCSSLPLLATVGIYLHTTLRGKFAVWAKLVADMPLSGDERVLDLGCGRGAVMAMMAKRLSTGAVVGLDLWTADQTGNTPGAAQRNLAAEGVSARAVVVTANMTGLPLRDNSFDVVVSSMAIHNIDHFRRSKQGCLRAIEEAVRVLRPGGRIIIADIGLTPLYARHMREIEMQNVRQHTLGWRFWYGPGVGARLVTATKPANSNDS